MSDEVARLIVEGFERYNAGDIDGVVALATEDIHAHIPQTMPNAGDYRGPAEFRHMLENWNAAWGEYAQEVEAVEEIKPGVIVVAVRFTGRGHGSGVPVDQRQAQLIEVRDGRLAQWRLFHTRDDAMQHAATL